MSAYGFFRDEKEEGQIYYNFFTDSQNEYKVYFLYDSIDFDTCSNSPIICDLGYLFGFTCIDNRPSRDARTFETIKAIILDFFNTNGGDCVLFFSCEDLDLRHHKRKSVFCDRLIKESDFTSDILEVELPDGDKQYPGFIFKSDNEMSSEIQEEFENFALSVIRKNTA